MPAGRNKAAQSDDQPEFVNDGSSTAGTDGSTDSSDIGSSGGANVAEWPFATSIEALNNPASLKRFQHRTAKCWKGAEILAF